MTIAQALLSFTVLAALLTVIPGLDTVLVLRGTLARGRSYGVATALGICSGTLVWGALAAVGASAVLATSEIAYRVLTYAGAAYMIYLGISMIVKSFRSGKVKLELTEDAVSKARMVDAEVASIVQSKVRAGFQGWLVGLGTNLLNPKVGVFYIATIPLFIPAGVSPLLMGIALASIHAVLGMVWFTAIMFAAGFAKRWLRNAKATKIVDRITGGVLIGFGAALAIQQH